MMTPEERATLAASDHYARRLRQLTDVLRAPPYARDLEPTRRALTLIDRARSAELRDPEPSPYTLD